MLDLDARVHLDEVHRAVFVHQEFDGAGVAVADLPQRCHHLRAEFGAQPGADAGRRRFFDQLLVAALDAALALAQVHHVAVAVAQHLKFDVPRALDEFFEVDVGNAEGLLRFVARRLERRQQFVAVAHHAHAAAAAAGRRLDDHRIADALGFGQCGIGVGQQTVAARHDGQAGGCHFAPRLLFLSHQAQHFRRTAR